MKTVKAISTSSKPITLPKAAKILSKFVSAENGASQAISAYLRRASDAFNELNQVHKDIRMPHSERKHKRRKSEMVDSEKTVVKNEDLGDQCVQYEDKQGKQQTLIKEEENHSQSVARTGEESNTALKTNMDMDAWAENHKERNRNRKPDVEAKISGDHGGDMRDEDEVKPALSYKLSEEQDHKVDNDGVRKSVEKKHKRDEKKKNKDKSSDDFIDGNEVHNLRIKDEMENGVIYKNEKKHKRSGVDAQRESHKNLELEKGRMENEGVDKEFKTEDVKREERKKRKNDDVEDKQEDGSREQHTKKKRRKKSEGDD